MRRSRSAFAFVFIVVASILYLTRLAHSATLEEAYSNVKSNAPSFIQSGWTPKSKGDALANGSPNEENYPLSGTESDSIIPGNSNLLTEIPLKSEQPLDLSKPPITPVEPSTPKSAFEDTIYPFQEDLALPLPNTDLTAFSTHWPHNYNPSASPQYAYAAFMNTRNPSIRDPYFLALQNLIWRVLWSPRTHTTKYPFIAFVAEHVTAEQRSILAGAGAIVRELPSVEWNPPQSSADHPIYGRWRDMFSKLHMWSQIDFERILFLDADAFPVTNIDAMFELAPPQKCNFANLEPTDFFPDGTSSCGTVEDPESYIFAAVQQGPSLPVEINVGAMVFTPSTVMHRRFMQNYGEYESYVTHMADQGLMSWQFKIDGAFPVTLLDREWDGYFPQESEKGRLKIVHEKLWMAEVQGWIKEEWDTGWREMVEWYDSAGFVGERNNDDQLKELLRWSVANGH